MKKVPVQKIETKDFIWLLKILTSFKCNFLKIPDTLVFDHGSPILFVYSSHNILRSASKIKFHEIISLFMRNVYKKISLNVPDLTKSLTNSISPSKKSFPKYVALLRLNNGSLKLLDNTELVNILTEKPKNPFWNEISSIQSVVSHDSPLDSISKFHYNCSGQDTNLSMPFSIAQCLFQSDYVLISAEFELVTDCEGTQWLTNVSSLNVQKRNTEVDQKEQTPIRMSEDTRKVFLQGIDYHSAKPKSKRLVFMQSIMATHYSEMKKKLMIDEALSSPFHFAVP